jgi:deoxyribodipyrimidine photo-lyase
MIHPERVRAANAEDVRRGKYVLYWMQASQRAEANHALEYAIGRANELGLPLLAFFGITDSFPEANLRHYTFMLEGLAETRNALAARGVQLVVWRRSPDAGAEELAKDAALLVMDRGYLKIQRRWRAGVARRVPCAAVEVESDVVIPVEAASNKEEYSAATMRPKIHRRLPDFLVPLGKRRVKKDSLGMDLGGIDLSDPAAAVRALKTDATVTGQRAYLGGTSQAKRRLAEFLKNGLARYADDRNDPTLGVRSNLSPYLHFGQISPLYVALRINKARGASLEAKAAFLEELIVRRELSVNFVVFNEHYDSFRCLPDWAARTLQEHARDGRRFVYTAGELERARTHDPYWNAAMTEMIVTGKMANYMRMYWGKKIIEWSRTPRAAFATALRLNNKYFLDGRDPNSFAAVAWCFGKHDRPWAERPVFGKVRYMNAAGLRRKFDIEAYVEAVGALAAESASWGRRS